MTSTGQSDSHGVSHDSLNIVILSDRITALSYACSIVVYRAHRVLGVTDEITNIDNCYEVMPCSDDLQIALQEGCPTRMRWHPNMDRWTCWIGHGELQNFDKQAESDHLNHAPPDLSELPNEC